MFDGHNGVHGIDNLIARHSCHASFPAHRTEGTSRTRIELRPALTRWEEDRALRGKSL
jgi:hypothetical protein